MVCFRNISVNTLSKGDNNNSNNNASLSLNIVIIHYSAWHPPCSTGFFCCCSSCMGRVCTGWVYSLYLYINLLSPSSSPNLPQHLPIWHRFRSASWKGMFFVSPLRKVNALLRYTPPSSHPFIFRLPTSHGTDSYSFISLRFATVREQYSSTHIWVYFPHVLYTLVIMVLV
jgi:hypothetical protein